MQGSQLGVYCCCIEGSLYRGWSGRNAVTSLAFSLDGMTLVSGSNDSTCRVWDSASRACVRTLSHPKGEDATPGIFGVRGQGIGGLELRV